MPRGRKKLSETHPEIVEKLSSFENKALAIRKFGIKLIHYLRNS